MIRDLVRQILQRAGYRVMLSADAEEALDAAATHAGPIHLVIVDLVLPRTSGRELVERLRAARPEASALYMSGYAPATIAKHGLGDPTIPLLEKPFRPDTILKQVRGALASRRRSPRRR
jgi:two-component system, cell cycle sensor histidine kinase and response regulator CckA